MGGSEAASFVFVEGKGCEFDSLVKALDQGGAAVGLVCTEELEKTVSDDISIPILTVSPVICSKLRELARTSGDLLAKFSLPAPRTDEVVLRAWVSLQDRRFFAFLGNFETLARQFRDGLRLQVNFLRPSTPLPNLDPQGYQKIFACLPGPEKFSVLRVFGERCLDSPNRTQCLLDAVRGLDRSLFDLFEQCYSYAAPEEEFVTPQFDSGTSKLLINEVEFRREPKPEVLFSAICSAFASSPDNCLFLQNRFVANPNYSSFADQARSNKVTAWVLSGAVVLLMLFVVAVVMGLVCTKIYDNILAERVPAILRETVTDYEKIRMNEPSIENSN